MGLLTQVILGAVTAQVAAKNMKPELQQEQDFSPGCYRISMR
jgi:hypothetical protein